MNPNQLSLIPLIWGRTIRYGIRRGISTHHYTHKRTRHTTIPTATRPQYVFVSECRPHLYLLTNDWHVFRRLIWKKIKIMRWNVVDFCVYTICAARHCAASFVMSTHFQIQTTNAHTGQWDSLAEERKKRNQFSVAIVFPALALSVFPRISLANNEIRVTSASRSCMFDEFDECDETHQLVASIRCIAHTVYRTVCYTYVCIM